MPFTQYKEYTTSDVKSSPFFTHLFSAPWDASLCRTCADVCGMRKFNSESVYQWSAKKLNTYKEMSCAIVVTTSDAITKFPITPMKKESSHKRRI